MQANISLMLNIILLIGVMAAIGRIMKSRKRKSMEQTGPSAPNEPTLPQLEDIIAVRKVSTVQAEQAAAEPAAIATLSSHPATAASTVKISKTQPALQAQKIAPQASNAQEVNAFKTTQKGKTLMFFLLAKENRLFAGYELLQTLLACGLRFGEGNIFHRHQYPNGQGPVMCSLAAATPSGVFDLPNIGAFTARGLCLFMETSGNTSVDEERFDLMLETGRQLSEGLNALLLDAQRRPLTEPRMDAYHKVLQAAG